MPSEKLQWLMGLVSCPPPPDECAIWPFPLHIDGYGYCYYEGRSHLASRVALILHTGINPKGIYAAHGPCHNRACVNPHHLSWKTPTENQRDRKRDGTSGALTADKVRAIRALASEVGARDLALRYKCSRQLVENVIKGRAYTWV